MLQTNLVEPNKIIAGCIEVYDNIIDNSQELIDIAEKMANWNDAQVYTGINDESITDKKIRSNLSLPINQFSYEVDQKFYEMCKTVWTYCNQYAIKYTFNFFSTENCQILKYHPGDFYDPHIDYSASVPRIFSALLYLNDVEEGGETEFIHFNEKIKPKSGRLVLFPSNYAYKHAALPPKDGNKYVAVFWMRG